MLRTFLVLMLFGSLTTSALADSSASSHSSSAPSAGLTGLSTATAQTCCKICHKGKSCGNTCISREKICHVAPGCACDG